MRERAVVLVSGGADSVTCLAVAAKQEGLACTALSFAYGQSQAFELEAGAAAAKIYGAQHLVVPLDPRLFAASALTGQGQVPQGRELEAIGEGIPVTYVPARNLVFLSLATALAETVEAKHIFIGVNAVDWSGYPDCRPEFIAAFQAVIQAGTRSGTAGEDLTIQAPLLRLTKAEIFKLGTELGVDYGRTVSCYLADTEGRACGSCDACRLRQKGFAEAGLADPTRYLP